MYYSGDFGLTLVRGKCALRLDVSSKVVVQHLSLEAKSLECCNLVSRNGNIEVLIRVEIEGNNRKGRKLSLDRLGVTVGCNAVGLVAIISDLPLRLGHSTGKSQGCHEKEGGGGELHDEGTFA